MRKITLYISMSLDGYAADRLGGVDWLYGSEPDCASWRRASTAALLSLFM